MAASKTFGPVVATRRIRTLGMRPKTVMITIGQPRLPRGERDWECPFRISGAGIRILEYGYGVDAIQALEGAHQGIRCFLDKSGKSWEWLGMPSGGFMRFIPMLHPSLTSRLEKLIDAEIKRDTARLRRQKNGDRGAIPNTANPMNAPLSRGPSVSPCPHAEADRPA